MRVYVYTVCRESVCVSVERINDRESVWRNRECEDIERGCVERERKIESVYSERKRECV